MRQADTALLATVLYVIALGLYSLFVDDTIPMPLWLRIRTLGDLKELLASVVIVVIAVVFLGFALTWDGSRDLLILGLSCAAVSAARGRLQRSSSSRCLARRSWPRFCTTRATTVIR